MSASDTDSLVLRLEGFEGPLDLLLDLARAQKVDLAKISILALVEQYLAVIALLLLPHLVPGFDPLGDALNTVVPWAINLVLRLAGHDVQGSDVGV